MEGWLEQLQTDKATQVGVAFALVAVVTGAAFFYFASRKKRMYLFPFSLPALSQCVLTHAKWGRRRRGEFHVKFRGIQL